MARLTRAESKERTRQRLLTEAQRLFRERGYAATSLEQIAEAAEVTKGAIYGHFASKEDLMLSALEAAPAPDYSTTLNDQSRSLRERLAEFGRAVAAEEPGDTEELAVYLEFFAALLRAPDALQRYSSGREGLLQELANADGAVVTSWPRGSHPYRPGPSGRRCWSACRSKSGWPPALSRRRCSFTVASTYTADCGAACLARTGTLSKPRSTSSGRRAGGAASSSAGYSWVSSSMAMRPSSRASAAPRQ